MVASEFVVGNPGSGFAVDNLFVGKVLLDKDGLKLLMNTLVT